MGLFDGLFKKKSTSFSIIASDNFKGCKKSRICHRYFDWQKNLDKLLKSQGDTFVGKNIRFDFVKGVEGDHLDHFLVVIDGVIVGAVYESYIGYDKLLNKTATQIFIKNDPEVEGVKKKGKEVIKIMRNQLILYIK